MNRRASPGAEAVTAGWRMIGSMVGCAVIGFGLGSLFGLAVLLGLAGLFVGLVVGFLLVYSRYRRI